VDWIQQDITVLLQTNGYLSVQTPTIFPVCTQFKMSGKDSLFTVDYKLKNAWSEVYYNAQA
jgi:hypothetical protein